jgi:hypothetical protein
VVVDKVLEIPLIPVKFIVIVNDSIFVNRIKIVLVPIGHRMSPQPLPWLLS